MKLLVDEFEQLKNRASPPGNGGRGLKLPGHPVVWCIRARIASRKRGAWIETYIYAQYNTQIDGIASRKRGAWIETLRWGPRMADFLEHRLPETGGVD